MSVNDPFVMSAFAEMMGGREQVNFVADGNGELTKALGLDLDLSPVMLGPIRAKRFTMIIKNNVIQELNVENGAMMTEKTCANKVMSQLPEHDAKKV